MHSVNEALAIVLDRIQAMPPVRVDVGPPALGMVLSEAMVCDLDSPPFAKAMMDGYAIRTGDSGERRVIEEVLAGQVPTKTVKAGEAARIMTGAPMPHGADAVVMVEKTASLPDSRVRILEEVRTGKNVFAQGSEMKSGETIFSPGIPLGPEQIGVLAGMGKSQVKVHRRPTVAVAPTGDEIVEVWETPGPGQIRNSNGRMLMAQVARAGGAARWIGVARDNEPHLHELIGQAMESDVVVLSGGVSAGKVDLVPAVLASMGVSPLIHKVRMKPGKPLYFGVKPGDGPTPKLIFGLPGNPVSSLVCFELFVRPAIRKLMGLPPGPKWVQATLAADATYPTDRPTYHPARLELTEAGWSVRPVPWLGSPDLRGMAAGNSLVLFPEGSGIHRQGDRLEVLSSTE